MAKSGIYAIASPSGRVYVGSTTDLAKRKRMHFWRLQNGTHHCAALQRAFLKYGKGLTFTVLEYVGQAELLVREQFHMDARPGRALYNTSREAGRPGPATPEGNAKIRAAKQGVPLTPEHRASLSAAAKGRKLSPEHRAKLSAALKGRNKSPEHAAKVGLARRGKVMNTDALARMAATKRGSALTAEHRAKIAAGLRAHYAELVGGIQRVGGATNYNSAVR